MRKQVLITSLLAAGFGTAVVAQEAEEELAVLPPFEAVDANEDGMIDTAETEPLAEMLEESYQIEFQFSAVDANGDGVIDTSEYVAYDGQLKEALGIA